MAAKRAAKAKPATPTQGSLPDEWTWQANSPLRGCGLMRERQWIYAWDDAGGLYLLDLHGSLIATRKAPAPVNFLAGADTGECLIAVSKSGDVWRLDKSLEPQLEIRPPFDPIALAVDSHGYYFALSSEYGRNIICDRNGRKVADFESTRPFKHLHFVASDETIIGASEHGLVACYTLHGREVWHATPWSNIGSLAVDGYGETVLLACFSHGLVRLDSGGGREGIYRYDYSPCLVAMDFDGSNILAASLDKYLTSLSYEGAIRFSRPLSERPNSLGYDALGRYAVIGFPSGELQFAIVGRPEGEEPSEDEEPFDEERASPRSKVAGIGPDWEARLARTAEEVTSAVLEPIPQTDSVAVYTNSRTLRILDGKGEIRHESDPISGLGRAIRVADHWLLAATDSELVAHDPAANESTFGAIRLSEVSYLGLFPAFGDVAIIESRQFVTRFQFPKTTRWRRQLEVTVASAAISASGDIALSLDEHTLVILDSEGKQIGKYRAKRPEPMEVVALDDGWATSARDAKLIRGHEPDGGLLWATTLPWAPWTIRRVGKHLVVTSVEGYSVLMDQDGEVLADNREQRDGARYFARKVGDPGRLYQSGDTLIATTFDGKLIFRYSSDQVIGPYVAGPQGAWVFLGRKLCFFPFGV